MISMRIEMPIEFTILVPSEIEKENLVIVVDQVVGNPGNFLTPLVVDVSLGVDHRQRSSAVDGHLSASLSSSALRAHRDLLITTVVPFGPDSISTSSISPLMICQTPTALSGGLELLFDSRCSSNLVWREAYSWSLICYLELLGFLAS